MPRFNVISGKLTDAPIIVLYGVEGIGKSTFASQFPNAIFIDTEGSTKELDLDRLEKPLSWNMLLEEITDVKAERRLSVKTLVIDTLDWAERLCAKHICESQKWNSIESPGYGKGYVQLAEEFSKLLDKLSEVAAAGITVVCVAHAQITKFEQPDDAAPFDRWCMKLTRKVEPLVKEWCDTLLFANYKSVLQISDNKAKAVGQKRVMYCNHAASFDAKNRWGLPDSLPFEFASIAPYLTRQTALAQPSAQALYANGQASTPLQNQVPVPSTPLQNSMPVPLQAQQSSAPAPTPVTPLNNPVSVTSTPQETPVPITTAPQTPAPIPTNMPTAPAPAPIVSRAPEKLTALRQLMASAGIDDALMQETVASQGYIPREAPLEVYPPELLDRLITNWQAVKGVAETLSIPVPFN